jgi:lipid-A-disaccharide synthase
MRLFLHQKELAVVGLVEAIGKIRLARRVIRRLVAEARSAGVDGAVLVDSPDFNLPLAKRLAKAGVPVVFYVSPQVWAWRSGRARSIAKRGRAVLVLFAFEKRWWDSRALGANVRFVGHPLVDQAAAELASPAEPAPGGTRRVVLMPGSRSTEVRKILPLLRDAVAELKRTHQALEVVLVKADSIPEALLLEIAGEEMASWRLVAGKHLALLASADVLLVASGTATVEGLLARVPMVVVYKVHPLSFFIGKRVVKLTCVAMPNVISDFAGGGRAVPELIQRDATPQRIAAEAAWLLDEPARAGAVREALSRCASELGPPGASARAADAILEVLGKGHAAA